MTMRNLTGRQRLALWLYIAALAVTLVAYGVIVADVIGQAPTLGRMIERLAMLLFVFLAPGTFSLAIAVGLAFLRQMPGPLIIVITLSAMAYSVWAAIAVIA